MTKGLSRGDGMVDARGVRISPGDVAIYGFGVGRSVAMAEGRIRDDGHGHVSTTPSGRVWVTIVRRSYGGGEEERVHVAPDRLVVLKPGFNNQEEIDPDFPTLPPSPLPTQDQANRDLTIELIERNADELAELLTGSKPDKWLRDRGWNKPDRTEEEARAYGIDLMRRWIPERLARLAKIETRLPCCDRPGNKSPAEPRCACPCHLYDEELHLK